ncbi:MAG: thiamine phosphate synthase [Planctomycetes bacterium]|nr:thiamine phosphate synthase [Planctomycetota bacterium]
MPSLGQLCLLFTPSLCRSEPAATLAAALDGGVDLVQWRCKTADRAGFAACRELCLARHVPLIVNDDVMLAVRTPTAGAHVGQDDMPADAARKLLVDQWLGVSTHSIKQIQAAAAAGADYVGFGPCFPTATKGYEAGLPAADVSAAVETCDALGLPLFAIGGIDPARAAELAGLGVRRVAVSSFVLQHDDPTAAARSLRRALR